MGGKRSPPCVQYAKVNLSSPSTRRGEIIRILNEHDYCADCAVGFAYQLERWCSGSMTIDRLWWHGWAVDARRWHVDGGFVHVCDTIGVSECV